MAIVRARNEKDSQALIAALESKVQLLICLDGWCSVGYRTCLEEYNILSQQ